MNDRGSFHMNDVFSQAALHDKQSKANIYMCMHVQYMYITPR